MFSPNSKVIAPIILSAALFGCRDEQTVSKAADDQQLTQPPAAHSLVEAQARPDGIKVYLTNVTLVPMTTSGSNRNDGVRYQVVDSQGRRATGILNAPSESLLWALVPFAGARSYSDFGAILNHVGGERVLEIFKLAN